jgi:SAM-dependent methyltransferase
MQRCRLAFLEDIPVPRRVLLAGEGHGRFLLECVRRYPESMIVVVDASAAMLRVATNKLKMLGSAHSRIEFVHADVLQWTPPEAGFDLIVTHFFLDCFTEKSLAAVVARLGELATPNAHWLLADFQIAPSRWARLRCRVIVGLLYGFFRVVCGLKADSLASPDEDLEKAGFCRHAQTTSEWGLLKSEWWRRG